MNRYEGSPAVVIERRKGTPDSPFSDMNESLVVTADGKVVLSEIPNELNRVIVTSDDNTTWFEITEGQIIENRFKVDYINKIVTFNTKHVGKQLHFKYVGEGNHYYSPHSIYTKLEDKTVVETLGDIVEGGKDALDALKALNKKLEEVTQATDDAITATDETISATNDARDVIDRGEKVIVDATNKIDEMDGRITIVDDKLAITDTKLAKVNDALSEMDNTLQTANQTIDHANNVIDEGRTVIDDSVKTTKNAQLLIDESKSVGEFVLSKQYKKNNTVLNNGSTWIALQDTQNNSLPVLPVKENTYWRLVAQRGVDGKGAVSSVNGILPEEDGNVVIDIGLLAYTKAETDGLIAETSDKFTSQGYASNDLASVTEVEFKDSTISGFKQVKTTDGSFLPDSTDYLGQVIVDVDGAVTTKHYQLVDVILGVTFTRVIRTDGAIVISDSEWVKGGGSGSGGKFVTVPMKLKTTTKNQKNWTIPNDSLDLTTDSVLVYFNTVYLRPEEFTIIGSAGTGYKLNFDSPESEIADNNIDIVIFKNVPDLNGLISGTALVDGSVGMTKLSGEVKDAIAEAGQAKRAWKMGEFNNVDVINLGARSVSKTLYIDGINGGWNGTDNVETLNITIPFDDQFSGIVKATYTSFWGHSESHGGATVTYRVANYLDRGGVKQADYIIETITDSFAKTYDIKKPMFLGNELVLPIMKAPMGSMPFMIKLEVDGYLGENKLLFDSVNASTCKSLDTGSPTGGGYPWKAQTSSFLNSTGGTVTGDLTIDKANATLELVGKKSGGVDTKFQIKHRGDGVSNGIGADFFVDGDMVFRMISGTNIQFKDDAGVWTSLSGLKQSVSDGKKKVASAITGKGVNTASDATFDTMANNINQISTGKKFQSGTVTSSSGNKGYTYASGTNTVLMNYSTIELNFVPALLRLNYKFSGGLVYSSEFMLESDGYYGVKTVKVSVYNDGILSNITTYNLRSSITIDDGIRWVIDMPVLHSGQSCSWVAYGQ